VIGGFSWAPKIETPMYTRCFKQKWLHTPANLANGKRENENRFEHRATLHQLNGNAIDVALAGEALGAREN
jgi:hypothetical protein